MTHLIKSIRRFNEFVVVALGMQVRTNGKLWTIGTVIGCWWMALEVPAGGGSSRGWPAGGLAVVRITTYAQLL